MILVSLIRNEFLKMLEILEKCFKIHLDEDADEPDGLHVKMFQSTITEDYVGILLLESVVFMENVVVSCDVSDTQ